MASPHRPGCRTLLWLALLLAVTLADDQQERKTLTVGAGFGAQPAGRSLFDQEPALITEPLPGQEFVFISAANNNPTTSHQPAAGGRTARINFGEDPSGTILNEDGLLVLDAEPKEQQAPASFAEFARGGRQLVSAEPVPPPQWQPSSLPELLSGGALRPDVATPVENPERGARKLTEDPVPDAPVPEQFSVQDAIPAPFVQETREGKAIEAPEVVSKVLEHSNLIPAETVSSRTVIKTASNGQDYEYEYLYYDEGDLEGQDPASKEPSLIDPDQNIGQSSVSPSSSVPEQVAAGAPRLPEDHVLDEHHQTHFLETAEEQRPVPRLPEDHVLDEHHQTHFLESTEEQQRPIEVPLADNTPRLPDEDHVVDQHHKTQFDDHASVEDQKPVEQQHSVEEEEKKSLPEQPAPALRPLLPAEDHVEDEHRQTHIAVTDDVKIESHQEPKPVEDEKPIFLEEVSPEQVSPVPQVVNPVETSTEKEVEEPLAVTQVAFTVGTENEKVSTTEATIVEIVSTTTARGRPRFRSSTARTTTSAPVEATTRGRSKSRIQSAGGKSENAVSSDSKTGGDSSSSAAGRRRINNFRRGSTTAAPDPLSARQGLAEDRLKTDDNSFDFDDVFDLTSTEKSSGGSSGEMFDEDDLKTFKSPANSRFPSHFNEEEDVQGRSPLRVVDSSSFRGSGNTGGSSAEQLTSGRLTVISGPARLPPATDKPETKDEHLDDDTLHSLEEGKAPHIIQAEVVPADEVPAVQSHSGELEEAPIQTEEKVEEKVEDAPAPVVVSPSRPNAIDVLAFSRAAELEQQREEDEHLTEAPEKPAAVAVDHDFEDVFIEEVHDNVTISKGVDDHTKEDHHDDTIDKENSAAVQHSSDPVTTSGSTDAVPEVDSHTTAVKISEPVVSSVEDHVDVKTTIPSTAAAPLDELEVHTDAPATEEVATEEVITEPSTTTTSTTTKATTTTTTTTTTEGSTTRGRGQSRFGNGNQFSNRVRGRNNGTSSSSSGDVPTSTSAPVIITKKPTPNFSRTNALNIRLRGRPTTTSAPSVETSSSEKEEDGGSSAPTTTRRTISPSIRNRFNIRRGEQQPADQSQSTTAPSVPATSAETTTRAARPRPSSSSSGSRVVSPRPNILARNRGSTTTSTTAPTPIVEEAVSVEATESSVSVSVEESSEDSATKSTTTTTEAAPTTNKAAALDRLKNRASIAVSERPKPVRNQVSLNDRRNRITALNARKPATEDTQPAGTSSQQTSDESIVTGDADELAEAESSIHPAISSPVWLRSLRSNRRPGQLAARPAN